MPESRKEKLQWYVAYTSPRAEKKAFELLQKSGIECFLPLQKILRQWSDRKKWVEIPVFPSYIFIKIYQSQLYEVLNTPKIVRYIYFEGKPAVVRDSHMEALRQILANNIEMDTTTSDVKPGDMVKIVGGPLSGMEAEMVDYRGAKKVILRLEQIGQFLLINIPVSQIIVLKKAQ